MPSKNKQHQLSPETYIIQRSRNIPIGKCWVNKNWEEGGMAEVLVTRNHSNGNTTYCLYMMDMLCLGIKESAYFFNKDEHEFAEFWEVFDSQFEVMEISYTLAHNIIYAGWEFAEGIGFAPHKDFTRVTQYFLEEDSDDIELLEIECGRDGKPLYVQGPYDSPARAKEIMNQLNKSKGQSGFDFILDADSEGGDDDDDFDSYEEDYGEDYDFDEEFDEISFEEKVTLFNQLSDSDAQYEPEAMQEQLYSLTNSLCQDIILEEDLEILETNWKAETEMAISQKTYTPAMLGLDEDVVITDEDVELLNTIVFQKNHSPKSLQILRKKWGDIAFLTFLNLQYFVKPDSEDFQTQLSQAVEKYPDNATIKLEQCAQILLKEPAKSNEIIFEDFFQARTEITFYEMFKFQTVKLSYFNHQGDLAALEAMHYQLEDIFDNDSFYFTSLNNILMVTRIALLKKSLNN